jgi:hypothetical protein
VLDEVEENLILEMENIRLWQYRFKMAIEQASTRLRKIRGISSLYFGPNKERLEREMAMFYIFQRSMYEPDMRYENDFKEIRLRETLRGNQNIFSHGR